MKEIDFTKMKFNTKKRLFICPECDRIGERHLYTNGGANFVHKGRVELGMFLNVTDSCYIKDFNHKSIARPC